MQTLQMHACGNTCTCAHWLQTARYPGEEGCQILQQDLTWGHITLKKKIKSNFALLLFLQANVKINMSNK